jgi:uncharacterized RDD family membrane protein YckC
LFVLLDNAARGPMPRVFVEERVRHGLWPASVSVAEVGSSSWHPFGDFDAPAAVAAPALEPSSTYANSMADAYVPTAATSPSSSVAATATATADSTAEPLPPGAAIHAGFWRRCAALIIDSILIGIVSGVVQAVVGVGMMGAVSAGGNIEPGAIFGMFMLPFLIVIVGQWLYFALFESGAAQATPGKMAMGIKVVDSAGRRIGFGCASGRFFGKIVSSIIFNIGYLMAGWTARKQALHDIMAGTLVVFNEVKPGQPLPSVRPPMPWYGWLLNILMFGGIALAIVGFFLFASTLAHYATGAASGGF